MSETAVSYEFQELEPSDPPPRYGAERLLAQAAQEAVHIREQARARATPRAAPRGGRGTLAEMQSAIAALGHARAGSQDLRGEVADTVERDAVDLALALAGKILAGTLHGGPRRSPTSFRGPSGASATGGP